MSGRAPAARPPVVVLVAPTASGKSDVAMSAARAVAGTEIVAVDSMQVYTGMDVGTAKPTAADRAAVVHHGLDLASPVERFTVARYVDAVGPVLHDRAGPLLLVAGTGLYLTALIDDLNVPGEWPELRAELERRAGVGSSEGAALAELHDELRRHDPAAAGRIEPTNRRRIVRALEVCLGSGQPFSSFGPGVASYPQHGDVLLGLRWDRAALARRIEQRVTWMVEHGLVEEVRDLRASLGGALSSTAAQALGYREVIEHLDGVTSLDEALAKLVLRTRQFAVRQLRWYGRDPRIRWIGVDADPVAEAAPAVVDALQTTR